MKELVLDLSHWDGDIDLKAWKKKQNLWGVIIKAGGNEKRLGRYQDSNFDLNYKKAVEAGLHIGFYYYTVTTDIINANEDAEHMMRLVGNRSYDLPWYMDVEDPAQFKLSKRTLTEVIKTFCKTLANKGHYSGLYTGGSAWLNDMYRDELSEYANWIAWWKATWPSEAGDIGMWQQGGIRYLDGNIVFDDVSGYHDCNWCVVDYPSRIRQGMTKYESASIESNASNATSAVSGAINSLKNDISDTQPLKETSVSGKASDVINAAYGELGYYAPNDPERGSKYGRWMAKLMGEDWLAGPSTSIWWCCMFVSWCLKQGGVEMAGFPTYNTDLALKNGAKRYAVDKKKVQYGDIVIFNWDWNETTDHIGFATGEFDGVGFTTIEGNVGNKVVEKYRQLGNVAYILRPPYKAFGVVSDKAPSVSSNAKNNRDGGKLDVDGIGGWNTIIDLQHVLGTFEDGVVSGQRMENRSAHRGMTNVQYDRDGSSMVRALQKKIGADIDGHWGQQTSKYLNVWLCKLGYKEELAKLKIGYFNKEHVKVLQKSLNDGKWN